MNVYHLGWLINCLVLSVLFVPGLASAQSSQVEIRVGNSGSVALHVKTGPGSQITAALDSNNTASGVADASGIFETTIAVPGGGLHELLVRSRDNSNRLTDPATLNLNVSQNGQTSVSIFLPPVLSIADTTLAPAEPVKLIGSGYPGSTLLAIINDQATVSAPIGLDGNWSLTLDTNQLEAGQYEVYVKAQTLQGEQSHSSAKQSFQISADETRTAVPSGGAGQNDAASNNPGLGQGAPVKVAPLPPTAKPTAQPFWSQPLVRWTLIFAGIGLLVLAIYLATHLPAGWRFYRRH